MSLADGGSVDQVFVHNGEVVRKGQLIARTDAADAKLSVEKASRDLENARIALADKLIGLGYNGISDAVPTDVMHRAKVTSGYFAGQ